MVIAKAAPENTSGTFGYRNSGFMVGLGIANLTLCFRQIGENLIFSIIQ